LAAAAGSSLKICIRGKVAFSGLRLEYGLATVVGDLVKLKVEDR
jgi:hypothetical protein